MTPRLPRILQEHDQYTARITQQSMTVLGGKEGNLTTNTVPSEPQPHQYLDFLKLVETRQGAPVS